jgi:structural maintenance of chromosome 2
LRESTKCLKVDVEQQKKRVNFKVDAMFDDTNSRYEQLMTKRDTIEENKRQVEKTIEYLNQQKNEELSNTWKIVSKNMGEIF